MKARQWVKEFEAGREVATLLMLKAKQLYRFRDKPGSYLSLTLMDRTGEVEARVWENAEETAGKLHAGQVLAVEGLVTVYNGQVQLKVNSMEIAPPPYPEEEFLRSSPRGQETMRLELRELVCSLLDPHLKKVLEAFFLDQAFLEAFCRAPAAKMHHQAYLGGLLEHSLNVARLTEGFALAYPHLNRDLLLAGALLHDIGKVRELSWGAGADYTSEGRLLGHIVLGTNMLERKIGGIPDFPEQLRLKLLHMLVSHHGEYEWQSPKRPKFAEALLLHRADLIDADIYKFSQVRGEGEMVYSKSLERFVFFGEREVAAGQEEV